MDKAEFINWLHIRTGYVFTDKTNRDIEEKLDEYAQQVSREDGFLFWEWVHKKKSHDQRLRYNFNELWNDWKLNQEEQ